MHVIICDCMCTHLCMHVSARECERVRVKGWETDPDPGSSNLTLYLERSPLRSYSQRTCELHPARPRRLARCHHRRGACGQCPCGRLLLLSLSLSLYHTIIIIVIIIITITITTTIIIMTMITIMNKTIPVWLSGCSACRRSAFPPSWLPGRLDIYIYIYT